jgi:uncharacterized protein (TIGR03083 family)
VSWFGTTGDGTAAHDDTLDDVAVAWGASTVVALLGDTAEPPPLGLKAAVLDRVRGRVPAIGTRQVDPVTLYSARVRALRALLDDLRPGDWARCVSPYDWSVHAVVAHLLVIERYTATRFGIDAPDVDGLDGRADHHLTIGAATIADELGREPEVTAAAWAVAARRIVDLVTAPDVRPDRPVRIHGWSFSLSSALVTRSLELWTHADDIRRAIGRPTERPPAEQLRTISAFSVRGLPFLVQLRFPGAQVVPVRVVLTGDGGGTYDIGGDGEPVALLALDTADFCRLVAQRATPRGLDIVREGDRRVIASLLDSAPLVTI